MDERSTSKQIGDPGKKDKKARLMWQGPVKHEASQQPTGPWAALLVGQAAAAANQADS